MAARAAPPVAQQAERAEVVCLHGREVARYVWTPDLPLAVSPRPYLHPVRTLAGRRVTDARPDAHPHQLGISIVVPDVDGCNFWGGRTFVAGHGPAWLDNHGIQQHQRWLRRTSTEYTHSLRWIDARRTATLLWEHRSISCRWLGETAWLLGIQTDLTNATDRPLPFSTPAAKGRAGAGYGGVFWRAPTDTGMVRILSPIGTDVRAVHGKTAAWVAVNRTDSDNGSWTMLFVPADETTALDRWFVRARDYLGVGLSPTWDQPLVLQPGEMISRHLLAVVIDGAVSLATAGELADVARSVS